MTLRTSDEPTRTRNQAGNLNHSKGTSARACRTRACTPWGAAGDGDRTVARACDRQEIDPAGAISPHPARPNHAQMSQCISAIVLRTPCLAQMGAVVLRVSATSHGTPAVSPSRGRVATACPLRSGPRPISADTPLMPRPPLTTERGTCVAVDQGTEHRLTNVLARGCILLTRARIME